MNNWELRAQAWSRLQPPLRPSPADCAFIARWIDRYHAGMPAHAAGLRVLILGATPEYHALPWPAHTRLLAADVSSTMLDQVWPGPRATTLCRDWLTLPPDPEGFDLVLGDGSLSQLRWPDQHTAMTTVLHGLLKPGGLLLLRMFVRESGHEDFDTVLREWQATPASNVDAAKLRLWLACQRNAVEGVSPPEFWRQLAARIPDVSHLARLLGTSIDAARRITDEYLHMEQLRFHFVPETDLMRLFCGDGRYQLVERYVPDYPLGQYCPSVALRTTAAGA
ncbi:MAG TPA: class I SAM-dependent methyltransferase [Candidatus Acidoferrum sp.]|nr:class I SAM-dependent methyltransferase [Candidatus Acidoferrum sp.]